MCGIFAAVSFENVFTENDFEKFKVLTDLVSHRGPNSSGYNSFNTHNGTIDQNHFNVFLGHKRLAIIDLSAEGNQPMRSKDHIIIYNGEIFNYLELKQDLEKENVTFKTKTDTEVILKLYEKYGESSFYKLNGMWAIIIVDLQKQRIVISRDRFSIKPLFYIEIDSKYFFASEIKQLISLLNQREINRDVLARFLKQGLLDFDEETFIKNVFKVKPKTNLIIDLLNKKLTEEQYWSYEIETIDDELFAIEKFNELFVDSIRIRLRSDVETGALLSGGLDSSAIAVTARELTNNNFKTFSIISDEKKFSEEKFVDILIRDSNIINEKIRFKSDAIMKNIDEVIYHQDEPFGSFGTIAHFTMLEHLKKKSNIVVILSGQGGDELLLGYLRYFFFYLNILKNEKKYIKLLQEIFYSIYYGTVIMQYKLNAAKRYMSNRVIQDASYLKLNYKLENTWEYDTLVQKQMQDIDKYSVPILNRYEDRNSMAFSLEIRLPFLDHRLVNLLLSIADDLKIKKGWNKYILRHSMTNLPDQIRWRKDKKGFITPEETWLKNQLKKKIKNTFSGSSLSKLGLIDDELFLNYYNRFLNGDKLIHSFDISRVFIAEIWARQFVFKE